MGTKKTIPMLWTKADEGKEMRGEEIGVAFYFARLRNAVKHKVSYNEAPTI
jgi:hypothetical protein